MKKSISFIQPLAWSTTLLLTAVLAACGGGGSGSLGGGGTSTPGTTIPGAGTGLGGLGKGPAPVVLGVAGNYVILAKSGISNTGITAVTGNLGVSPIGYAAITGFSLVPAVPNGTNTSSTSTLVTGLVYASDYTAPTPATLTTAISNMLTAYTDAAGRAPDYTELGAGDISGMTLAPGTYKWSSGVLLSTNVKLNGGPNDVWIFEIAQDLTVANSASVTLTGGALPKNIFWQVAGGTGVAIGTTAHMEGVIMAAKAITLNTGASANSRLLAQAAVTLNANTLTQPAP